jgi:orotidine-5'-phosphate decarboxylase
MVRALDRGNAGLVVGATAPDDIAAVRRLCPDMPLLVPGVGPQGGDLEAAVAAGLDREGGGLIVVAARRVLYADGRPLEPQAVRRRAQALRDEIERARQKASSTQGHAGGG